MPRIELLEGGTVAAEAAGYELMFCQPNLTGRIRRRHEARALPGYERGIQRDGRGARGRPAVVGAHLLQYAAVQSGVQNPQRFNSATGERRAKAAIGLPRTA
jgi:hypothetical protein